LFLIGSLAASTGVHDELYARALVLDDGELCIAVVTVDLLGLNFSDADHMCDVIRERTGMPDLKVLLCFSHTHSAPRTINWSVKASEQVRHAMNLWLDELPKRIGDVVAAAAERRVEVTLTHGRAAVQIGMNRRLPCPEGIRMAPNPEGAVVPWTDVLVAKDMTGAPMAVLYSHAAHPVIVHGASTLISADYPGFAAEAVQNSLGKAVVPLFACGCAGDCNGEPLRGGFDAARKAGRALGAAVADAVEHSESLGSEPLRWLETQTSLPFSNPPPREEIRTMLEGNRLSELDLEKSSDAEVKRWYEQSARFCLEEILAWPDDRDPGVLTLRIEGFAIGNEFALVGLSHEPFAAYQLATDRTSPFAHTMMLGYVNGVESYLPTDQALAVGGYEAAPLPTPGAPLRYAHRLNLASGVEQRITHALTDYLQRLAVRESAYNKVDA